MKSSRLFVLAAHYLLKIALEPTLLEDDDMLPAWNNKPCAPSKEKERLLPYSWKRAAEGNFNFSQEYILLGTRSALMSVVKFYFSASCGAILIFRHGAIIWKRKEIIIMVKSCI